MAVNKRGTVVTVPWDVFEAISDAVRDQTTPYMDNPTADQGHPNLVLWGTPYGHGNVVITPQREDPSDDGEDQAGTWTDEAPA